MTGEVCDAGPADAWLQNVLFLAKKMPLFLKKLFSLQPQTWCSFSKLKDILRRTFDLDWMPGGMMICHTEMIKHVCVSLTVSFGYIEAET